MVLADISIVNIAAPSIQRGFGATGADLQLLVVGYQLAYATLLIMGGRLGDIYGRRRLFNLGLGGFVAASVACGLAASPTHLVIARVFQGGMAAVLYPQVVATINLTTQGAERAKAYAALGAVISLSTIAGPLLAGVLIWLDFGGHGWRWIFLINLPIGVALLILGQRRVPTFRSPTAQRLDGAGALLLALTLLALLGPLILGRAAHWPAWTLASLVSAPLIGLTFLRLQRRQAERSQTPLLPPGLWRDPAFRLGLGFYVTFYSGVVSFFLFYSVVLQHGLGLAPFWAGLATVPYAVGSTASSLYSSRLVPQYGGRALVVAGSVICSLGTLLMLLPPLLVPYDLVPLWLAPALFITGIGLGFVVAPLLTVMLASIVSADVGGASGLLSTAQQVGGALGVALIGIVFFSTVGTDAVSMASPKALIGGFQAALVALASFFLCAAFLASRLPRQGHATA